MQCGVVTIFPEMFRTLESGIVGRALRSELLRLQFWNPRDFTLDKHSSVDDRPYGGGPGMVMKAEPLLAAINTAKSSMGDEAKVIYLSPQGKITRQREIENLVKSGKVILVAGRYEGIDERVCKVAIDEEWSIGDYVLSGGELAAMVLIDAATRLIPGALGDENSAQQDSFSSQTGLLDCPHYTRPVEVAGLQVPKVLLAGDHAAIDKWRLQQQLGRTLLRRPELLAEYEMSAEEKDLLASFREELREERGCE